MTYPYKKSFELGTEILDLCAKFTNAPYQELEYIKQDINEKIDYILTIAATGNIHSMSNKIIFSLYDTLLMYSAFIFNNTTGCSSEIIQYYKGKISGKLDIIKIIYEAAN